MGVRPDGLPCPEGEQPQQVKLQAQVERMRARDAVRRQRMAALREERKRAVREVALLRRELDKARLHRYRAYGAGVEGWERRWDERPGLRVLLYARVDAAGSLFPVGGGDQSPQPLCGSSCVLRADPVRPPHRPGVPRPARRPIGLRGARRRGERDPREGRAGLSPRRGSRSPRRARHRQARGVSGRRSDAGSRRPPRNARAAPAKPGRGSSVSTPTVPWPPTSLLSTTASSRVSAAHGRVGRRRSRRP